MGNSILVTLAVIATIVLAATASVFVRQAVAISLVSSVAQTYLQLRELDLELQITRSTLDTRQETARIAGVLYRNGLTNELDLRQAEGAVAASAAALPELERAIVMVSFGVLMQATFSFVAASYFGRHAKIAEPGAAPTAAPTEGPRE